MGAERKNVSIYTATICLRDSASGAYGVVLRYGGHCRELVGGFPHTSQRRVAIYAMIAGLEALNQPCNVTLYATDRYVVEMTQSAQRHGLVVRSDNSDGDRWQRLMTLCETHCVEFVWAIPDGQSDLQRCQELARDCLRSRELARYRRDAGLRLPQGAQSVEKSPRLRRRQRESSTGRQKERRDEDVPAVEPSLPPPIFLHDPRESTRMLPRCPHGVLRIRRCYICNPR